MTEQQLINELFLELFKKHYREAGMTLADLISMTRTSVHKLHGKEEAFEDIRQGAFSEITIAEAVEKIAFEMKNDRNFYTSYKDVLASTIFGKMTPEDGIVINDTERAYNFAELCAEEFLDKFIEDTLRNRENNEIGVNVEG